MTRALREGRGRALGWIALAGIGTTVAIVAIINPHLPQRRIDQVRVVAREAAVRPTYGRLSGYPFAPLRAMPRGAVIGDDPTLQLRAAARAALLDDSQDPATLGAAQLIAGKPDAAVQTFTAAAAQSTSNAAIWNDLSVAYIERGEAADNPEDLAHALASTDRALRIDGVFAEAHFNRAIVLERLHLDSSAAAEYGRYLVIDGSSAWSEEAQSRRSALLRRRRAPLKQVTAELNAASRRHERRRVAEMVAANRQETRSWCEVVALRDWALGSSAATDALWVARETAASLITVNDEHLLADAVAAVDRAVDDPQLERALRDGQIAYYDARVLYSKRKVVEALGGFERARQAFATGDSPMQLVAAYYVVSARFDSNDTSDVVSELRRLRERVPQQYRALRAQITWEIGTVTGSRGIISEELREYKAALRAFESLGEEDNAATMRAAVALALANMGRDADAWRLRIRSFEDASRSGDASQLSLALSGAARAALQNLNWDIGRALLTVALENAPTNPRLRFHDFLTRALATWHEGDSPAADLAEAQRSCVAIADPQLREASESDLALARAAIVRQQDPREAVRLASEYIAFTTHNRNDLRLPTALLERARAERAAGDVVPALKDLNSAVDILEERRGGVAEDDLRDAFFGTSRGVFEEIIDLYDLQHDAERAFEMTERMRARVISDRLAGEAFARSMSSARVAQILPHGALLLEYVSLESRLIIFSIDRSGLDAHNVTISRSQLERETRTMVAAAKRGAEEQTRATGAVLYERFIAPVDSRVATASSLIIVQDDGIATVPFAALFDSRTRQYLMEKMTVIGAPSSSALALGSAFAIQPPKMAFIVGDPDTQTGDASLPRLPGARAEALDLGQLYGVVPLIDSAATKTATSAGLLRCDVAHIAAHAILCRHDSSRTFIALASGEGSDGTLTVRQIASLHLARRPVIVLAGCGTAAASDEAATVRSISTAFIAAGARAVVGSLWNIDDETSRTLTLRFHRELRRGRDAASALREAQIAMMHSKVPRALSTWTAFQVSEVALQTKEE